MISWDGDSSSYSLPHCLIHRAKASSYTCTHSRAQMHTQAQAHTGTHRHTEMHVHRHTQAQIDVHIQAHADTHTGKVTGLSVGQVSCMTASATAYQVISRNRRRPTASATSHPPGPEINTVTQSQGTA